MTMNGVWGTVQGWLLHSAVGGGLLLLLAWTLLPWVRQPARRQRLAEWGVLAALLAAALSLGPSWLPVALPLPAEAPAGPADPVAEALRRIPGRESVVGPLEADAPPAFVAPAPGRPPISLAAAAAVGLGLAYAVGAVVLLGRWLLGYVALWRLLRSAEPAPERAARLFTDLTAARRRPRLLASRRLRVPVSCGLLRPTVVLPWTLCQDASDARLRCVLAHELTHLERRDAWTCLLFALAQVVFFYVPWFWWLRRQVRLCQEYVADAAAVDQAEAAEDYAEFLLELTSAPVVPLGAVAASGQPSDLFWRVTMLLQATVPVERRCPRGWLLLVASGLLALAVVVAGIDLRAEARPPADSAEKPSPRGAGDEGPLMVEAEELPPPTILRDEPLAPPPPVRGLDPARFEAFRRQGQEISEQMRKAMEQVRWPSLPELRPMRLALPVKSAPAISMSGWSAGGVAVAPGSAGGRGVLVRSGSFSVVYREGALLIAVTGSAAGDQVSIALIRIADVGIAGQYEKLNDVPEPYRGKIHVLLSDTSSPARSQAVRQN
jgi:beta-lactamase regulating signal transducer with metallopeptidase domain